MKQYEQIDISGDAGLRVYGDSIELLFENAAAGMYDLITDVSAVRETEIKEMVISAENHEDLLVRWLNELVFLYDTYGFTGRRSAVRINSTTPPSPSVGCASPVLMNGTVWGETFNPDIHERRLLIKAVTYHNLTLTKRNSGWEATVIFDI